MKHQLASNVKPGNLILIGNIDNEISQHFSLIESYGLIVGHEILRVDDENVYVTDYTIDKEVAIPFNNIYKLFDNVDKYNKWRKEYMDKNDSKILDITKQRIEEHYKEMPNIYFSNKHFYESALCDYVYNDFVKREKEMER